MNLWIYLVISGILAILWAIILPKQSKKTKQGNSLDDLENSLNSFTEGIQEDKRELSERIQYLKREHELQKNELMMRIEYLERKSSQVEEDTRRVARTVEEEILYQARLASGRLADGAQVPAGAVDHDPEPLPPQTLRERFPELFELYDQGKSIEFIAKKIAMNKGEVILIIDLAKQGEEL